MCAAVKNMPDGIAETSLVRSLFIRGHGQRDLSAQEVAHCNLNLPLVRQTVKYISLDLRLGIGARRLNLEDDAASLVCKSIMECYAIRCDESQWGNGHEDCAITEADINLHSFALRFICNKMGKIVPRAATRDLLVVNAFPKIAANRKSKLYPLYCLNKLILWKPWINAPDWDETNSVEIWEAFSLSSERSLDTLLALNAENAANEPDCVLSVDSICSESMLYRANVAAVEANFNTSWNQIHSYDTRPDALALAKATGAPEAVIVARNRNLDDKQQSAVNFFCSARSKCVLLIGAGGTGKSEVVFKIKENLGSACLVTATTGKAAALIDGETIHCAIKAPVKPKDCKQLASSTLEDLQHCAECVTHVVIDEFSMMNGNLLYWIDKRLKQAKCSQDLFGGCSVLLSGDPAQLSPVGGSPLWAEVSSASEEEQFGKSIYKLFDNIFYLVKNYRQGSPEGAALATFLCNYRNGALTEEDFLWFESRSSEVLDNFQDACNVGVHLFPTNDKVNDHNMSKLAAQGQPVAILQAINSDKKAAKASKKLAGGLDNMLCLCVGASVMLTQNLWTVKGLVNGAVGTVVDFLAADSTSSTDTIVVDIPRYRGPPLCGDESLRLTWVPIPRSTAVWFAGTECMRR